MNPFNQFIADDDGAVTVDWVVLTAAIIGLGVAVMTSVGAGSTDLAGDVKTNLTDTEIAYYGPPPPTFGEALIGFAESSVVNCPVDGSGNQANCGESYNRSGQYYAMSDGTKWLKEVVTIGNNDPVTTWYNQDGEAVDAPEAT